MPIKLLICTRSRLFAHGLRELLTNDSNFEVLGICWSGTELQPMLAQGPDLALCDLPGFMRVVRAGRVRILLVDEEPDFSVPGGVQSMVSKGLVGIVSGDADPILLRRAIGKVQAGEMWFSRRTLSKVLCNPIQSRSPVDLTRQEIKVLKHIRNGSSNKEIAQELCISEQTVKTHCTHLYKKFDVSSRVKLALLAADVTSPSSEI